MGRLVSMPGKRRKIEHWRVFWDNLGFPAQKVKKQLKKFDKKKQLKRLQKAFLLTDSQITRINTLFGNLNNDKKKLTFLYLEKFFNFNKESILKLYKKEPAKALIKLANAFKTKRGDFSKIHFRQLWIFVGRGRSYKLPGLQNRFGEIKRIKPSALAPIKFGGNQSYHGEDKILFDDELLFVLRKGTKKHPKFKFVNFSKKDEKVYFSMTFSFLEISNVLFKLTKLGFLIDLNPKQAAFEGLLKLINGEAEEEQAKFKLYGVTFEENGVLKTLQETSRRGPPQGYLVQELKRSSSKRLEVKEIQRILLIENNSKSNDFYKVSFNRSKGLIYLNLDGSRLSTSEYYNVLDLFGQQFNLELNAPYIDPAYTEKDFYQEILNNKSTSKFPGLQMASSILVIYNKLLERGIILKPTSKRYCWVCVHPNCRKNGLLEWSEKTPLCNGCRTKKKKAFEVLDFLKDEAKIIKAIKEIAVQEQFVSKMFKKQVFKKKINLVKVLDKNNDLLTVAIVYSRKDVKYIEELCKRCTNIMVLKSGVSLDSINEPVFVYSLGDFFYNYLENKGEKIIQDAFNDQLNKWGNKVMAAADSAKQSLSTLHVQQERPANYFPVNFELDCFNLIYYIFKNAAWLGINESGEKLPDGVAAIPRLTNENRGCFIWDCKLSFAENGAGVGDVKKNKEYLKRMVCDEIIEKLGGLKCFCIISNKPSGSKFNKTFKKLKRVKKTKSVSYVLLDSRLLLKIFEFYKQNQNTFEDNRQLLELFYSKIYELLTNQKVKEVSKKEIDDIMSDLKTQIEANKRSLLSNTFSGN